MRFMILVKGNAASEAGAPVDESLFAAMADYHEELVRAGVLLDASGLQPTSRGWRIRYSGGKGTVIDGPFTESKELVAGYTLIQVKSREEALEWSRRFPAPFGAMDCEIEVRQLYDLEDFDSSEAVRRFRDLGVGTGRQASRTGDVPTIDAREETSMSKVAPYLFFDGNCAEAMRFYERRLGGKLESMFKAGEGPPGSAPPGTEDRIMHAHLSLGGSHLMASDWMSPQPYERMQGFYVSLHCASVEEGRRSFEALAEGGNVHMPFEKTFWAEGFGMLADRFGTPWMVNVDAPRE